MVINPSGPGGTASLPENPADFRAALLTNAIGRVRGSATEFYPLLGILPTRSISFSLTFRNSSISVPRKALSSFSFTAVSAPSEVTILSIQSTVFPEHLVLATQATAASVSLAHQPG